MDDVMLLISVTTDRDNKGVLRESETSRQVFCRVKSIRQSEFFQAGRNGLNPEWSFTVFHADYAGEEIVEYAGKRYKVYRTFHVPGTDDLEIYTERRGGKNG